MLKFIAALGTALLVLSGCDAIMPVRGEMTRDNVEAAMQEASLSSPPERKVSPAHQSPALPMPAKVAVCISWSWNWLTVSTWDNWDAALDH